MEPRGYLLKSTDVEMTSTSVGSDVCTKRSLTEDDRENQMVCTL